jgi:hypothetical protein
MPRSSPGHFYLQPARAKLNSVIVRKQKFKFSDKQPEIDSIKKNLTATIAALST